MVCKLSCNLHRSYRGVFEQTRFMVQKHRGICTEVIRSVVHILSCYLDRSYQRHVATTFISVGQCYHGVCMYVIRFVVRRLPCNLYRSYRGVFEQTFPLTKLTVVFVRKLSCPCCIYYHNICTYAIMSAGHKITMLYTYNLS